MARLPVSPSLAVLALLAPLAASARADDIEVPAQAATIQLAIGLADDGDRVLVAPGTYAEVLSIVGKSIEVIGTAGAAATIVDASGIAGEEGVLIASTGPGTRLDGLTIRGATMQGVRVTSGASVVIERCIVEGSASRGIQASSGTSVLVEECLVRDNAGGGTSGSSSTTLVRCRVEGNGGAAVQVGGGCIGGVAIDCWIVGNEATFAGGGGADMASMDGCVFAGNTAEIGGGYHSLGAFGVSIANAAFVGNVATGNAGGAWLVALTDGIFGPSNGVTGCVFAGNVSPGVTGLISDTLGATPDAGLTTITGSTFAGDTLITGNLTLKNTIVWGTPGPIGANGTIAISYSDVQGGAAGTGNIDADPLFVAAADGVVCLRPASPCIDAGDPASPLDPDGSPADIGAAAFTRFCAAGAPLFGGQGFPALSGSGDLLAGAPVTLAIEGGPASASVVLVLGGAPLFAPLKGGTLVPAITFFVPGLPTDPAGDLLLAGPWPPGIPSGFVSWAQVWAADAGAPTGFTSTNGLALVAP